ncbi:hypothetical protein HC928_24705 [bacterium]|nr:hypothetical protein [bacterium]
MKQYRSLSAIVGVLDRLLYCSAYLLGAKKFIAVWLAVKLAGQWSPAKEDVDRILYHIFLTGNGMNIIISVSIALVIQLCLRP